MHTNVSRCYECNREKQFCETEKLKKYIFEWLSTIPKCINWDSAEHLKNTCSQFVKKISTIDTFREP